MKLGNELDIRRHFKCPGSLNRLGLIMGRQESNVVVSHVNICLLCISLLCTPKSWQKHYKIKVVCLLVYNLILNIFYNFGWNSQPNIRRGIHSTAYAFLSFTRVVRRQLLSKTFRCFSKYITFVNVKGGFLSSNHVILIFPNPFDPDDQQL